MLHPFEWFHGSTPTRFICCSVPSSSEESKSANTRTRIILVKDLSIECQGLVSLMISGTGREKYAKAISSDIMTRKNMNIKESLWRNVNHEGKNDSMAKFKLNRLMVPLVLFPKMMKKYQKGLR
mmetsp:Transcript_100669/g.215773  ORF Transcript_100669/g.215773 Transcript_100669/m.215773 type:complete len:124 (-) Transcript_100669:12-383(-)